MQCGLSRSGSIGSQSAYSFNLTGGLASLLMERFSVGVTGSYLKETLGELEQRLQLAGGECAWIAVDQQGVARSQGHLVQLQALAGFHPLPVRAQGQLERVQRVVAGFAARRQRDGLRDALVGG